MIDYSCRFIREIQLKSHFTPDWKNVDEKIQTRTEQFKG